MEENHLTRQIFTVFVNFFFLNLKTSWFYFSWFIHKIERLMKYFNFCLIFLFLSIVIFFFLKKKAR